jgi:hypothetical protein
MVGFNPTSAFSMPQASRFSSPRKASSVEDDDFQPINTSTEEPEEAAEIEPAAQTSKKRHAPLPQHFTPLAKPSGHNWLAYAGIGTVATGVGALGAGVYKSGYLPYSSIDLKENWSKKIKSGENQKIWIGSDLGTFFVSDVELEVEAEKTSPITQIVAECKKQNYLNEQGEKIEFAHLSQTEDKLIKRYDYFETYKGETNGKNRGQVVLSALGDQILVLNPLEEADNPYAFITTLEDMSHNRGKLQKTITAIKPTENYDKWRDSLALFWGTCVHGNESISEIHQKLQEAGGFTIEQNFSYDKTLPIIKEDAFKYTTWEEVAKAALKNEADLWKLIPRKDLFKFVGGGALAGLAVAGAGIGLWELAHKKQPSQTTFNRQG